MSTPRCKPGDLAVVVSTRVCPELIGRFVIVERAARPGDVIGGVTWDLNPAYGHPWVIRSASGGLLPMRTRRGTSLHASERVLIDSCMRPIRPNDAEDESLSWSQPRITEAA